MFRVHLRKDIRISPLIEICAGPIKRFLNFCGQAFISLSAFASAEQDPSVCEAPRAVLLEDDIFLRRAFQLVPPTLRRACLPADLRSTDIDRDSR